MAYHKCKMHHHSKFDWLREQHTFCLPRELNCWQFDHGDVAKKCILPKRSQSMFCYAFHFFKIWNRCYFKTKKVNFSHNLTPSKNCFISVWHYLKEEKTFSSTGQTSCLYFNRSLKTSIMYDIIIIAYNFTNV